MSGPAELTYSSLLTDVPSYVERPDDPKLAAQMPRLLMLAENRIATDARILGTKRVVQGAFEIGNPVVPKPAYWRQSTALDLTTAAGKRQTVFLRSYEFCRQFWPTAANTDVPRYYADYNFENFFVAPTPAAALAFELVYVARIEPLSDANESNWLTINAPQLLLAATLLECETWLKNFRNVGVRKDAYTESLSAFKTEDSLRTIDRSVVFA